MFIIEPKMVNIFWACNPISFKHMSFRCPFLGLHLTTHHSNIGVQIVVVMELSMSSLPEHNQILTSTMWWWHRFLGYLVASNILLMARLDQWPGMTLVALVGYLVSNLTAHHLSSSTCSAVSAFAVGVAGSISWIFFAKSCSCSSINVILIGASCEMLNRVSCEMIRASPLMEPQPCRCHWLLRFLKAN